MSELVHEVADLRPYFVNSACSVDLVVFAVFFIIAYQRFRLVMVGPDSVGNGLVICII